MSDETEPPPPPYNEAVHMFRDTPSLSASDPQLGRQNRTDQRDAASRRSQQYLSGQQSGSSHSTRIVSDSPHSSDDEETAMLKSELRRLRDKDSNEQKKALLRQLIEQEREAAGYTGEGAGPARPQQWQPPPVTQHNYPGAIIHPIASNIPGASGTHPYAAPLQCPSTSGQYPGPSTAPVPVESPVRVEDKEGSGCIQCVAAFGCIVFTTVIIVVILIGADDF